MRCTLLYNGEVVPAVQYREMVPAVQYREVVPGWYIPEVPLLVLYVIPGYPPGVYTLGTPVPPARQLVLVLRQHCSGCRATPLWAPFFRPTVGERTLVLLLCYSCEIPTVEIPSASRLN